MKKCMFYLAMVAMTIVIWVAIGAILALSLSGIIGMDDLPFGYNIGFWTGRIYSILLAIGITLLFRPMLHRLIFKETKAYRKDYAFYLIGIGILFGALMIGKEIYTYHAVNQILENIENNDIRLD